MTNVIGVINDEGKFSSQFYAAGVKFRPNWKENLEKIEDFDKLILEPEPTNKFDKNAIKILHGETHIGYVPAKTGEAEILTKLINEGKTLQAVAIELAPDFEPWTALRVEVREV